LAGRIAPSVAAGEGEALARGTTVATREAVQIATRESALKGAVSVVSRVLLEGLVHVLAILDVIGWALLVVELVNWLFSRERDEAIQKAVEEGLKKDIPAAVAKGLDQNKDEVARHYARAWLDKHARAPVFLYLSPRIIAVGGYRFGTGFTYTAKAPGTSVEDDLVSTTFLQPQRDVIYQGDSTYEQVAIRWSIANPIYTPFQIYLAFTEFFAEHLVDSWAMNYATGLKMSQKVVTDFHRAVSILAEMSATLKFEPWYGWVPSNRAISSGQAASERWEALQRLAQRIEKELVPLVGGLEKQKLVNPKTVRWDALTSPLRSELDPSGEDSLTPSMRTIAFDMRYLDAKYLDYERFETLYAKQQPGGVLAAMPGSIDAQKDFDLREFLKPVQKYLPKSLAPAAPAYYDFTGVDASKLMIGQ
jgi:hypothetical protein